MKDVGVFIGSFIKRALAYRVHMYALTFFLVLLAFSGPPYSAKAYLISLSFASLMAFIYVANKVTDRSEDSVNAKAGAIPDSSRSAALWFAWACALVPLVYITLLGNFVLLAGYLATFVLGYLYSFPINLFGRIFRFKQVLFLKTLTSSLIWAVPPTIVRIAVWHTFSAYVMLSFTMIFFVGAAMEMIWDVRDVRGDRAFNINTIPATFGVLSTQVLALIALALATASAAQMSVRPYSLVVIFISALFAVFVTEERPAFYFHAIALVWVVATCLSAFT